MTLVARDRLTDYCGMMKAAFQRGEIDVAGNPIRKKVQKSEETNMRFASAGEELIFKAAQGRGSIFGNIIFGPDSVVKSKGGYGRYDDKKDDDEEERKFRSALVERALAGKRPVRGDEDERRDEDDDEDDAKRKRAMAAIKDEARRLDEEDDDDEDAKKRKLKAFAKRLGVLLKDEDERYDEDDDEDDSKRKLSAKNGRPGHSADDDDDDADDDVEDARRGARSKRTAAKMRFRVSMADVIFGQSGAMRELPLESQEGNDFWRPGRPTRSADVGFDQFNRQYNGSADFYSSYRGAGGLKVPTDPIPLAGDGPTFEDMPAGLPNSGFRPFQSGEGDRGHSGGEDRGVAPARTNQGRSGPYTMEREDVTPEGGSVVPARLGDSMRVMSPQASGLSMGNGYRPVNDSMSFLKSSVRKAGYRPGLFRSVVFDGKNDLFPTTKMRNT